MFVQQKASQAQPTVVNSCPQETEAEYNISYCFGAILREMFSRGDGNGGFKANVTLADSGVNLQLDRCAHISLEMNTRFKFTIQPENRSNENFMLVTVVQHNGTLYLNHFRIITNPSPAEGDDKETFVREQMVYLNNVPDRDQRAFEWIISKIQGYYIQTVIKQQERHA